MTAFRWIQAHRRAPVDTTPASSTWLRGMGELSLYSAEDDREPFVRSGKPLALLAYVALSPGGRASRRHLAELLWPGIARRSQQHCLRQALYRLRHADSGEPLVRARGCDVQLGSGVRFDFREGEAALAQGEYERAERLLRGEFLEGFSVARAHEFERWMDAKREGFRSSWEQAARVVVETRLAGPDPTGAVEVAEALATRRPFDEDAIRVLMGALAGSEQHALAVARFRSFARLLQTEVHEEPSEELCRYAQDLDRRAQDRAVEPRGGPPPRGGLDPWTVVEDAWSGAPDGEGALLLVQGGARAGKSRFVAELEARARERDAVVLAAPCSELRSRAPYAAAALALRPVVDLPGLGRLDRPLLAEVAGLLPELRERFPDLPEAAPAEEGWAADLRLWRAVERLLHELAGRHRLVVAVDDLQWADDASLRLLHFLVRSLRGTGPLVLMAYAPDELGTEGRRFVAAAVEEGLARVLSLDDEDGHGIPPLLPGREEAPDTAVDEELVAHLERFTGGDPSRLYDLLHVFHVGPADRRRGGRFLWPEEGIAGLRRALEAVVPGEGEAAL